MTSGSFNAASVSALLSAVVSLIGGVGAWLLGRAPDWEDVRPLGLVGLTAAVAAACSFTSTLGVPVAVYVWGSRLQVLALSLHVVAWYAYLLQWGTPLQRARRWFIYGPLVFSGLLALVPGVFFHDAVTDRPLAWLGVVYHDPVPAPFGFGVMAVMGGYGIYVVAWLATLRGRALPYRRALVGVTATLLAMCIHDAVAVAGLGLPTPYLVDFALYLPALTIAFITLRRIVETATDLRRLRTGLEVLVVERTGALERSQAALFQSERLAALGQFAGGFAREVEHPVKVVDANLTALGRELRGDPRERLWARLADARSALAMIGALARQLLVAGRAATSSAGPSVDVRVGRAVDLALARGRAHDLPGLTLAGIVTPGLTVSGHEDEVVEVLTTLVLDGMARIGAGRVGQVSVRAEPSGARVRIIVEDDGAPLSEEALLHAFEPFHETERQRGAGLRRAVARGLVEGMGGTLRLERGERGTRAAIELALGAPDASAADLPQAPVLVPFRARILVADGDPVFIRAAVSDIGREHELEAVSSVAGALSALGARTFDMVLCDASLPGGGGERLWEELLLRMPGMLGRVAFLVGGGEQAAAMAFLDRQPQPVVRKPFGLDEVQVLLDWLGIKGTPPARGDRLDPAAARRAVGRLRPI